MAKRIPTSVSVGGKRVRIRVIPELESWGEYHHDEAEIHLAPRTLLKAITLRETLRHELMHAALSISGVGFAESLDQEAVIRCFDEIFFPAWDTLHKKLTDL